MTVSRRLYRDTGSDYRVNGRECRLKDVQDLLLDTGMGTRAYSFIQQGQIDLILSSKPKDRRSLLEEAAGITRYKLRRTDAERRLEETRANLLRLDDILFELGKQQESLKRQASKARRAQELDAAIRATQRILLAGKALELEAAKDAVLENLDALERRIAVLTAQVLGSALGGGAPAPRPWTSCRPGRSAGSAPSPAWTSAAGCWSRTAGSRASASAMPGTRAGSWRCAWRSSPRAAATARPSWRACRPPWTPRRRPWRPGTALVAAVRRGRGAGRRRPAPRGGRAERRCGPGAPRPRRRPWRPSTGARPCTRRSPSAPGGWTP